VLFRSLDYFLNLAENAHPKLLNGDPISLNRVEKEYDNMRAALEHSLAADPELALRLAMSLEWFWEWHNRVKEGYAWAMRLLPLTEAWGPGKLRARALGLAGGLAGDVPDRKAAWTYLQASLEMARTVNDKYQIAWSLYNLAVECMNVENWTQMRPYAEESLVLFEELDIQWGVVSAFLQLGRVAEASGAHETARRLYEQSLERSRRTDNKTGMTFALSWLARLARRRGDYASAKALYTESTQIIRQMGHKTRLAQSLENLGQVALHAGDHVRAKALFEEGFAIFRDLEDVEGQVDSLAGFAEIASVAGRHQLAARLFGAAEAAYETLRSRMSSLFRVECDPIVDKLRKQLDQETFDAAWQAGRQMTLEQAIEYARENLK
jgi:tetratricopeptide (TPR) repeat protein